MLFRFGPPAVDSTLVVLLFASQSSPLLVLVYPPICVKVNVTFISEFPCLAFGVTETDRIMKNGWMLVGPCANMIKENGFMSLPKYQ